LIDAVLLNGRYENAVTLNGMSKAFSLPGLRLGWLASRNGNFIDIGRSLLLSHPFHFFNFSRYSEENERLYDHLLSKYVRNIDDSGN
jgi:aspartate/methionine/tyrosine aminotransferase